MDTETEKPTLAVRIIEGVRELCEQAEAASQPLEVEPHRKQLFEYFVAAEGAGLVTVDSDPDLTADGLCRVLGIAWNLADATRASIAQQSKMSPESLARMRTLWSVMRMWMEWTYAWERYEEFHE